MNFSIWMLNMVEPRKSVLSKIVHFGSRTRAIH